MKTGSYYVGLMSGTSLDGIDAVLIDCQHCPRLLASLHRPFTHAVRTEALALHEAVPSELQRAALLSRQLAELYAKAVKDLLAKAAIAPQAVAAIGCHGQTVRHAPDQGYSVQLNNPALLAERAGIAVVADFRSRDIAAGGQGAPLVPAFHAACFGHASLNRIVINIGGIANITYLPARDSPAKILGFDTGPGNMLLDAWISSHSRAQFDPDGAFAASGKVIEKLLTACLADPYFGNAPPKSTGRDRFNLEWLMSKGIASFRLEDVQATLAELTACSVANAIERWCPDAQEIYICGGGAHNIDLMARLSSNVSNRTLATTEALGIHPDWVEAMAFAWLARETLAGRPGNLPAVTGAAGPRVLGAIYPA